jgi:hypothetical protein
VTLPGWQVADAISLRWQAIRFQSRLAAWQALPVLQYWMRQV